MKLQYLGTAAAEGIPALFCTCEVCRRSFESGGRAVRTRSQAVVNDDLLIDFPADTYAHMLQSKRKLTDFSACLITHAHSDHLYERDAAFLASGFSRSLPDGYHITFYGSEVVGEKLKPAMARPWGEGTCSFETVSAYQSVSVGRYTVTPLKALHDPNAGPLMYMISDGEKTILYAHDTNFFDDGVWSYWEKTRPHFDLVSLDCTNALTPMDYVGHMSLAENVRVREIMLENGYADACTRFVCNHFSHNGKSVYYDDFVPIAAEKGFLVSYDGMTVTI